MDRMQFLNSEYDKSTSGLTILNYRRNLVKSVLLGALIVLTNLQTGFFKCFVVAY